MSMRTKYYLSTNPDERRKVKQRLSLCLGVLRERHIADTYSDIAEAMGMNPVTVRSAFAVANPYLSERFLDRFLSSFPMLFSAEWLYTGVGDMYSGDVPRISGHTERWERVQTIMEREGLNHVTMSDAIGLNNHTTLYRVVRQHKKPQDGTLRRILRHYPKYREQWLLHGKGEPTEDEQHSPRPYVDVLGARGQSTALPFNFDQVMSFPVTREKAVAGGRTGYGDDVDEELSHVVLPVDRTYKGEYQVFSIEGASMDDGSLMSLADGDLVLARNVDRRYWLDGLHTRRWLYFIFVTRTDGILVKQVIGQDNARGLFFLHSLNPSYPDLVIDIRDIVAIYNVIQVIQRRLTY